MGDDYKECAECGKDMVMVGESCEDTDADGNRGRLAFDYSCECGVEVTVMSAIPCGRQF